MSDVVSTRLDKKEIEELNKICEKERIDRSALIRKFLLAQIIEYRLKEIGEKYRKGLVSLAEAATLAKVSIYEMMDYVEREKIQPPALSEKEMEEELNNANNLFNKIKKQKL
jgi:predicted HTH domain antitoxin